MAAFNPETRHPFPTTRVAATECGSASRPTRRYLLAELRRRWPDLTLEEGLRSTAIAAEILSGGIAEKAFAADAAAAAQGSSAAAEVQGWGEIEFCEIAASAGIPLKEVRAAMEAIQRGDPLPALNDIPGEDGDADREP